MQKKSMHKQKSRQWYEARSGMFTASEIYKIMYTRPKAPLVSDGAMTYIRTKVAERLFRWNQPEAFSHALQHGEDHEPEAISYFEILHNFEVEEVGFIPINGFCGGTPDGLLTGAILEIKCPYNPVYHIINSTIESDEHFKKKLKEYYWQCQMNMLAADVDHCYFVSYNIYSGNYRMSTYILEANTEDQQALVERLYLCEGVAQRIMNRMSESIK